MISDVRPFISMDVPTTSGEPAKRVCQRRWLMTATRWRASASSTEKLRPSRGSMPRTRRKLGVVLETLIRWAPSPLVSVAVSGSDATISLKLSL